MLDPRRQQWGSSHTKKNSRARHFPFLSPPQSQCLWPTILRAEAKSHLCGLIPSTHNTSVWSTSLSALPERNITIQAFALVQTSAELKANLLKTLPSPSRASPNQSSQFADPAKPASSCWLAAGLPGSAPSGPDWSLLFSYILQEVFLSLVFPCFSLSQEKTNQRAVKLCSV